MTARITALVALTCVGCDAGAYITPDQSLVLMVLFLGLGITAAIDRAAGKIVDAIRDHRDRPARLDVRVHVEDGKTARAYAGEARP